MSVQFLSHVLDATTQSYGNREKPRVEQRTFLANGDSANSFGLTLPTTHLGTHIDFPFHFFNDGRKIAEVLPNECIFNSVHLIDIPCNEAKLIGPADFQSPIPVNTELLLIRTGYEKYRGEEKYWNDNPGISHQLPIFLRKNYSKLRCLGIDAISITSWKYRSEGRDAHRHFLNKEGDGKPICIVEDMSLNKVSGPFESVIILPILIERIDSSPVSVLGFMNALTND